MKLILKKPIITEKTAKLQEKNGQYTFQVNVKANKNEIANAIKDRFSVDVAAVNTTKVHGKIKRMGRSSGKKSDIKKAVVTLKGDQKIEYFEEN